MEIIADTLAEAHEGAVDAILNRHKKIDINTSPDKKEATIEFESLDGTDEVITIKVRHPLAEPQISTGCPFGPGFTAAYKKQFLTLTPPREDGMHATYTYWNRHEDHPSSISMSKFSIWWRCIRNHVLGIEETVGDKILFGDGRGDGLKQITSIIEKLARDPNNRRGISITWNPSLDMTSTDPPCMIFIQVVIRNGKVHLRTLFRSQDTLLGLCENLVGAAALIEYITNEINRMARTSYKVGTLILISTIPHIYQIRDANYLEQMKVEINRKKTLGLWKVRVIDEWESDL